MSARKPVVRHARLALASMVVLVLGGVAAWNLMPRREDPELPHRVGLVVAAFPGADAETVESLVLNPLEARIREISEVDGVAGSARAGQAALSIVLRPGIDMGKGWERVRAAIDAARLELPPDAGPVVLDDRMLEQEAIVLAVMGPDDPDLLSSAANRTRETLNRLPGVAQTTLIGDPGEQITLDYDPASARRLGITPRMLARGLRARHAAAPGGSVRLGDTLVHLRPSAEFSSVAEIEATPVMLPSGGAVPLGEVAVVRRGPAEDSPRMRFNGQPGIAIGIVLEPDAHVVNVGERVRRAMRSLGPELSPASVVEISFQPDYVRNRLNGLAWSLLTGMVIVAAVLFWAMGRRAVVIVALAIPSVTAASLFVYWLGGGILHQVAVGSFVVTLGMLVDTVIVVVDRAQAGIDAGNSPDGAVGTAVRELRLPLTVATGTTIAAFVPMWLAEGDVADFLRTLPVVVVLTIGMSLACALWITPTLCALWLRGTSREKATTRWSSLAFERLGRRLSGMAIRRPRWVLVYAAVTVVAAGAASMALDEQFFPPADRNQLIVELRAPSGSHIDRIDRATRKIEHGIISLPGVRSVAGFVGRGVPRFYYNLVHMPDTPEVASLLVTTRDSTVNARIMDRIRSMLETDVPDVQGIVRRLEQGPPVSAPIELRFYGDATAVEEASALATAALKASPGAVDVRRDLDLGAPTVQVDVLDAAAGRARVTRADVAVSLLGHTRGLHVGTFRGEHGSAPMLLRSGTDDESLLERFPALEVSSQDGRLVPLGQLARHSVGWKPAVIKHYDGRRVSRVLAELGPDATFGGVLATLKDALSREGLPEGVEMEIKGVASNADDAQASLMRAIPLGVFAMLALLLWEFNSFRRVGIVLAAVPLAAVGVIPGLLIGGQPFGWMCILGVVAQSGVVVNGAIVLMEVIERERREGATIDEALRTAIQTRTRPILLTTLTTVGGLLPLAFSASSLWPPFAWSMITGLIAATLLTLLVIPALYRTLFKEAGSGQTGVHEHRQVHAFSEKVA